VGGGAGRDPQEADALGGEPHFLQLDHGNRTERPGVMAAPPPLLLLQPRFPLLASPTPEPRPGEGGGGQFPVDMEWCASGRPKGSAIHIIATATLTHWPPATWGGPRGSEGV